jgi:hypothetical protein
MLPMYLSPRRDDDVSHLSQRCPSTVPKCPVGRKGIHRLRGNGSQMTDSAANRPPDLSANPVQKPVPAVELAVPAVSKVSLRSEYD